MNQLHKINPTKLHVSYQSEVLDLRRALAELRAEVKSMKEKMNTNSISVRKISFSSNGEHHLISLRDIVYCEADGNYTRVYYKSLAQNNSTQQCDAILLSKSLKTIADLISDACFIRCHQSYVVNKNYITSYESRNGLSLKMNNEINIPVSRRKKNEILEVLSS